jgi:diguanylate cyclase (GGDEF)-like protein
MKRKTEKLKFKEGRDLLVKISSAMARAIFSFLIPGGLIILIAFLVTRDPIVEAVPGLARIFPWVILIAGILFAWRFNRSQLIFVILALAVVDRSLLQFVAQETDPAGIGETIYNAIAFLFPLNLILFSVMKERGILSLDVLMRLSLIPMQVFGVALISQYPKLGFAVYLKHTFFSWPILSKIPIPQPALIAFVFAAFIILSRYMRDRGVIECGFFWVLISSFLALISGNVGQVSTIYLSTGSLVLIIAVIETSFGRAYRDELTGLPARRALNEALYQIGGKFTGVMIDIDHFKKFNDRYGHHVGDQVLRMIASKLDNAGGGGRAFRYGGEEFAMIFPGKNLDETIPYLNQLRKEVADSGFFLRGSDRRSKEQKIAKGDKKSRGKTRVTISIGVAERNVQNSNPHQVIKAADKALYRAKNKGRNRVST